jgi:RHS repeat-associated protein
MKRLTSHGLRVLLLSGLASLAQAQMCPNPGSPCAGGDAASQGSPNGGTGAGNPIDVTSGNKYQVESDVLWPGELAVQFRRHYNSLGGSSPEFGRGWTHGFSTQLSRAETATPSGPRRRIELRQADGRVIHFEPVGAARDGVQRYNSKPAGYGAIDEDLAQIERLRSGKRHAVGVVGEDANALRPWKWRWIGGRQVDFDGLGRTRRIAAPSSATLEASYDVQGRLQRVADAHGRALAFEYWDDAADRLGAYGKDSRSAGARGRLKTLRTPDGRAISFGYDARQMLSEVRFADGTTTRYDYVESAGLPRLQKITGRDGKVVGTYAYDEGGRAISSSAEGGLHAVKLEYRVPRDAKSPGETWVTNTRGEVSVYRWRYTAGDGESRMVEALGPGCTSCPPTNRRYAHADDGRVSRVETLSASSVTNAADLGAHPPRVRSADITERDALGRQTARWRDVGGQRELVERWRYASDDDPAAPPNLIERPSVIAGKLYRADIRYDARSLPLELRETGFAPDGTALSRVTTFGYTAGRLTKIDGPLPGEIDVTRLEYDARGLLTLRASPGGVRETRYYDELGRVVRILPADGVPLRIGYDAQGRAVSLERAGLEQSLWYDSAARIGGTRDSLGQKLTFDYDAAGALASIVDTQGNRIELERDSEGGSRVARLLNPDRTIAIERSVSLNSLLPASLGAGARSDIEGALRLPMADPADAAPPAFAPVLGVMYSNREALHREVRDARGLVTTYDYDDFGRLVSIASPDSGRTLFAYDLADRVTRTEDATGRSRDFTYDAADRVTRLAVRDETVTIAYAANGRPRHIAYGAGHDRLAYDGAARLVSHERSIDGRSFEIRYRYDSLGRLEQKTLPDGQKLRYDYNHPLHSRPGLLSGIRRSGWFGSTPVVSGLNEAADLYARSAFQLSNGLSFEREMNRRGELTRLGTPGVALLDIERDAAGRVSGTRGAANRAYRYDAEGRLIGRADVSGDDPGAVGFAYDFAANPLRRVALGQTVRYEVDQATNRLLAERRADGVRIAYAYDAAGRLTQRGDLGFEYDGMGRLARVTRGDAPLAEYRYNALGERVKKVTHDGRDVTRYFLYENGELVAEATADSDVLSQYVWLEGRPVARLDGDALYALHTDWRGDILAVSDAKRAVVWRANAGAVAAAEIESGFDVPLRGSNQYFDRETGLHYNLNRYFDPQTQRFTTPDPIGQAGGLNLYAFAGGDPVNFVDPLGTQQSLPPDTDVTSWSFNRRLQYLLEQAIPQVPGEIGNQLRAMISPANIAIVAGIFAVWGVAQLTPAGWIADAAIGIIGYIFLGEAIVRLMGLTVDTYFRTRDARCIRDLNIAANHFAQVMGEVAIELGGSGAARLARLMGKFFRQARRSGAWDLNPFQRGHVIEEALGHNTPTNNYPVIDRWNAATGTGTSIKSLDVNASSYQNLSRLRSEIRNYITAQRGFTGVNWGGLDTRGLVRAREIEIAIPNAPSAAQQQVINDMIREAATGTPPITIRIIIFP